MSDFVHLHVHSEFSLLDGLAKAKELPKKAKELGMNAVALTDHGSMYGTVKFYQSALSVGVKPIIGVETYLARKSRLEKNEEGTNETYHLLLLAKNNVGYRNLMKLVTFAHLEGFYYKPRIDWELLQKYSEGLIATSGCLASEIPRLLQQGEQERAEKRVQDYAELFGKDHFYLEMQMHPSISIQQEVNKQLVALSRKFGIPLVATNDVHYVNKDDAEAHEILLCVQTQHTILESNRPLSMQDSPDFYLKSPDEMMADFVEYPEAIANTQKIADMCNVEIELGKWKLPLFEVPQGHDSHSYLEKLVYDRAPKLYGDPIPDHVKERIDYELHIIKTKGYSPYFLIVSDFVNWAKDHGIYVGPGRGSAAGSVVSYCINITGLDPFYFNLPFERFLNPERPSAPDIDLDFADTRRDEVIAYVTQKYGADKVAQIITFGTMEARAAVRDTGRALGMPYSQPDRIAKLIPIGAQGMGMSIEKALTLSPDLKVAYDTEPETKRLLNLSKKLEGVARHASVHAAGVVIADKPLVEYTPVQKEARGEKIVTQYDMYTVGEDGVGLLKMDFLGLRNLTIIGETLSYIKEKRGEIIDIENIPLDDTDAYKLLSNGYTTGVFQLESPGMRRYIKELKPTTIFDLMAMVALYRPGPMQVIPEFIARKHDAMKIDYPHPLLTDVLKTSYGLIAYQDDVLLTAITLASYSWGDADKLRKAVGKKIPAEMKKQHDKFIDGCKKNEISQTKAIEIWNLIEPFAGYGFNKAHAACYAMIAYQTAYLKSRYSTEFMTASLNAESRVATGATREEKMTMIIEECKRMNIKVLPPDINKSLVDFCIEGKMQKDWAIRLGLSAIKNVGTAAIEVILGARRKVGAFKSLRDFCSRVDLGKVNKKTLESLIKSGAMDAFGIRAALLTALPVICEEAIKEKKQSQNGQFGLFDADEQHETLTEDRLPDIEELSKTELLKFEKELLGFYLTEHPLTPVLDRIANKVSHDIGELSLTDVGTSVIIGGVVSNIKKIITKKSGQEMAFLKLSDLTGASEVVIFPKLYVTSKNKLLPDTILLIKGKVDARDDRLMVLANDIFEQ